MLSHSPFPLSLLITALLFFPLPFLRPSHGLPRFPLLLTPAPSGSVQGGKHFGSARRSLADAPGCVPVEASAVALAAERTSRKDPLNGFEKYSGGWNLSDRHYWASAGYTALPFFSIATIWFILFGLALSVFCACHFCCKRQPYAYSGVAYVSSLIVLIASSFAAIIGCIIMYTSQEKFHSSMIMTLEYVVTQADTTVGKLQQVSGSLAASKLIEIDQVFLPPNIQTDIDQIGAKINFSATNLADTALHNSHNIEDVLDNMRVALIVVAAVMLSMAFLGFLFSTFGMQIIVYILVIIGWILVTGALILCGVFLLIHNVTEDSCVAMDQWVQIPAAHTALDNILPCTDSSTVQEALLRSKEVSYRLVELMNEVVTNISNINFSPDIKAVYYNQSGPLLPILCNRFHADFSDRACSAGEIDMNNAEQVWQNYTCQVSVVQPNICTTTGRLTPTLFNQFVAAVNVGNDLYNSAPFLLELQDCTYAKVTFTGIYTNDCPHLRAYGKYIYVGLGTLAIAVMLSVIFWVIYSWERHRRVRLDRVLSRVAKGRKRF